MNKSILDRTKISFYTFNQMPFDLAISQETEKNIDPLISILEVKPSFPSRRKKTGEEHFARYNIFAYSFPEATLNINVIYKLIGQMILYLTNIIKAKDKDLQETAFCLLLKTKPDNLMKQLEESGITVEEKGYGIYYANFPFRFKIIVSKELQKEKATEVNALIEYLELKHK